MLYTRKAGDAVGHKPQACLGDGGRFEPAYARRLLQAGKWIRHDSGRIDEVVRGRVREGLRGDFRIRKIVRWTVILRFNLKHNSLFVSI